MNKEGHPETLVAAHPENRNAVRSGVFSPATRAPRVREFEAAITDLPAKEAVVDFLRRELAALAALAEAMDESLAVDGIHGRRGEPRTLVSLRMRTNDQIRKTAEQYRSATEPAGAEGGQWWAKGAFMISPAQMTRVVGAVVDVALNSSTKTRTNSFYRTRLKPHGSTCGSRTPPEKVWTSPSESRGARHLW